MTRSKIYPALVLVPLLALVGCGDTAEEAPPAADSAIDTMAEGPTTLAPPAQTSMVDPNEAGADELATVPGIDPALAEQIIAGRPYENMVEVDAVLAESLDEQSREAVYDRMWRPIDLNNATDEEILLIPGVGSRLLREFHEYRPFRSVDEFRREMGKYVDDDEVERLSRYVEVR